MDGMDGRQRSQLRFPSCLYLFLLFYISMCFQSPRKASLHASSNAGYTYMTRYSQTSVGSTLDMLSMSFRIPYFRTPEITADAIVSMEQGH